MGLGWNKNDDLLINSLQDKKVLVFDGKTTKEYADIGAHENNLINDMTTDASGRAYVGTVALESFNENIMNGLRLIEGLNINKIEPLMSQDFNTYIKPFKEKWPYLEQKEKILKLNKEGLLFADEIIADLFLV